MPGGYFTHYRPDHPAKKVGRPKRNRGVNRAQRAARKRSR